MASQGGTDNYGEQEHRHCSSQPKHQFHAQMLRERERLTYQVKHWSQGRPQTLLFDPKESYQENARNNIRRYWISQGIWNYAWDINLWGPCVFWDHELPRRLWEDGLFPRVFIPPEPTPEQEEDGNKRLLESDPKATQPAPEPDTSESRPYHQFLSEVSKEEVWIRDQLKFEQLPGCVDVSAKAYDNVKRFWIEHGIWLPHWGSLPGMEWRGCGVCGSGEVGNFKPDPIHIPMWLKC